MAMDVMRASKSLPYFLRELRAMASGMSGGLTASMDLGVGSAGSDPHLMKYIDMLERDITALTAVSQQGQERGGQAGAVGVDSREAMQRGARHLVDRLAIGFHAALLIAYGHSNGHAASAYIASRIRPSVEPTGLAFGANYGASAVFERSTANAVIDDHLPVFL